jgi:hypothetical protein
MPLSIFTKYCIILGANDSTFIDTKYNFTQIDIHPYEISNPTPQHNLMPFATGTR